LLPSAPETTTVAARTITASLPTAKSTPSAAAPPVSLRLLLPSPLPPTAPTWAAQIEQSSAAPPRILSIYALADAQLVMNDHLTRKSDHAALHDLPPATPATSLPTAPRSLPAVPHTQAEHK